MSSRSEAYKLGGNVTRTAKSHKRKDTVVLSVRISVEELARVEALAEATGRTVSQVAREAVSAYAAPAGRPRASVVAGIPYFGTAFSLGEEPAEYSTAPQSEQTA
jgi:hypothetical protein